jgi:hypothetical protein
MNRSKLSRASIWASFVATTDGATMFVGLYATTYKGLLAEDTPQPHTDKIDLAGSCDVHPPRQHHCIRVLVPSLRWLLDYT